MLAPIQHDVVSNDIGESDMMFSTDTRSPMGHPLFALANALADRVKTQRGLRQMLALDAHLQRDIGVTPEKLRQAKDFPTSQDVSDHLRRVSLERPGPWM